MPRRRRRHHPSKLRFLRGALWGAPFLAIALGFEGVLPPVVHGVLFGLFGVGCLYSAWLYHRDFVQGQYHLDASTIR